MQAYTPVATWTFAWHEYYAHHVAKHVMKDLHILDMPEPPRPKKVVVNTATNTRILVYGSPAVVQRYRQASVTNKQMADRFADNAGDMRDAMDGQSVMAELTVAIRREAGEGIDLALPTPVKRKEKSRRWTRRSRAAKPGKPEPQAPLASSPAGAPESA
jgi:hypothetical protein